MTRSTPRHNTNLAATGTATFVHPGQFVRDSVLTPRKLSVLAAAKLVGIGRPALSNFLNGHVATTPDMASRIEHAFGVRAQGLLDMQAAYDAARTKAKGAPSNAMPYVAPFLGIKATEIETWATRNIPARTRLSVLLRTLVNSTGSGLTKVDFPGNDDAQRPGWDGYIEAAQATPWIPDGISGWEFGTSEDIKGKADGDFAKSVNGTAREERDHTTFVFVTPRHWPGKADWTREKKNEGQWKDVRTYDSSDLEQWLEQSIAAQAWFANETRRPSNGVRSLDRSWADWADVASPPLAGSLFVPAIDSARRTMIARLSKQPDEPTVIAADSTEEALAFLAQLFGPRGGELLEKYRDRVLVFDEPGVIPKLAQGTKDFIAVAASREVERELGPLARHMQTIVVYPRNAANAHLHVVLEPLNQEAFRTALDGMGFERDDVTKYDNESGRSLTVLRRRLSSVPAVRKPEWAADHGTAISLIPFLFIGAWSSTNTADQTALTLLTKAGSCEELERECQRLVGLNDAPLWSVGTYRGVISKIDLLFAIAGAVTAQDLERYFDLAKMVLGEDDPRLDLPEQERWAAAIRGKSREFSAALREGVSETLVLLAVHGNHLFRSRLGFNCEFAAIRLIRELLAPLKTRILEANDRDLAAYAEAAPDEFLSILEEDLKADQPQCYGLMRPAETGPFGGGCPRTGLLWALEGLAWSPTTLPRAALILAQLAEIEIHDNWVNKPIGSLASIFRAWMPQTAADHDTRLRVMTLLADRFPKVAWQICLEQLDTGRSGHYSHKPRWRNDAHGFGEPHETWVPIHKFMREMADMALAWKGSYTREMLCDLIQRLQDMDETYQARVWELVRTWATSASDADKAFVRERIRVTVMSRRVVKALRKAGATTLSAAAKATYQALEPTDLLSKHEWLFRQQWVEESADDLQDDSADLRKREARITELRADALRQVFEARGLSGIFELAEMGKAAPQIGWLMAKDVLREDGVPGFLLAALSRASNGESWARKNIINGFLRALHDENKHVGALRAAKKELSHADFVRLLVLAPFRRSAWQLVDELDEEHRQTYWKDVEPDWIHDADDENHEAVERLLAVQRPRAAFASVHFKLEALGPELLFRLMSEMVTEGREQPGQYRLEPHDIEDAFRFLDKSPALTLDQKAGLEFAYIDALFQPWGKHETYGIPNLEKYVERHPEAFVQAVVWTYKRSGEGEDPPEWKIAPEQVQHFAERAYKLLQGIERIPGHDDFGELKMDKLATWVKTVRDTCAVLGRLESADVCIGKLLSSAPVGEDGVWPSEPVRQVMEDVHSKEMMGGARTGRYNLRGVTWRGEGGDRERELAGTYRAWANALQYPYPFVASELLMRMVKTYEDEASREDTEAGIRRRLR
jgi:addiction module HigA family antidote